jgi:hypothetical protein
VTQQFAVLRSLSIVNRPESLETPHTP